MAKPDARPVSPPSIASDLASAQVRSLVLRYYFGTAAAVAAASAVLFAALPQGLRGSFRLALVAGFALLALLSLWARRVEPGRTHLALTAVAMGAFALIGMSSWMLGFGVTAPGLAFLSLVTCMVSAVVSRRAGVAVAASAVAVVAALALADALPSLRPSALPAGTLAVRVIVVVLSIAAGLAGGLLLARLVESYVRAAADRERRFRHLLGLASSAYWESDAKLRLAHLLRREDQGQFTAVAIPALPAGRSPELWPFEVEAAGLQPLRDSLLAGQPFRDLPVRWNMEAGPRHLLLSGEPRRLAGGELGGYWGVARDVTDEVAARQAHERSQALLAQVVSTSPDVITLTDMATGRYEMVNLAFERLSGHSAAQAIGRTAVDIGIWQRPQDRDLLVDKLRQHGFVDDMAVDFRSADGRALPMRLSATRFDRDGRSYIVINARDVAASERARMEREAILANASIGIVITRQARIEMMNRHAERLFAAEGGRLVGRPTHAVLTDPKAFDSLLAQQQEATRATGSFVIELSLRRCDGSDFVASLRASPIDPSQPATGGTVWIVEDVTERRRIEQALARARDEAETANRAKSAFLANTSHEIRTPLNGLLGLARLARQPDLDDARRRQYLEQIADSAESLSAIITDILDLSKIEAGKLEVAAVPFDLHEMLRTLQRAYAALADAQGLGSSLHIHAGTPQWVRGDPVRLRQVLSNYLNNALKFTSHGRIDLVAKPAGGDRMRFEVHDSGPGIDPSVQDRLFRPFTQLDDSSTRRFGGTGLGLSICRELAALMGGEVGLSSRLGRGSCFHVELPLPEDADGEVNSGFGVLDDDPLRGARMLLVEDNAVNMMIAAAMLEQWGIQVSQAPDGPSAIEAVDRAAQAGRPFDLVLMDVQMPGMSGHEATRALRERYPVGTLPIVALTAAALLSEREAAFDAGMTDFVTKPIDARRLRVTLLRALHAL